MDQNKRMKYAFFDGDNIGSTIESLLLTGKINEAQDFSDSLNLVISEIRSYLSNRKEIEIIISGGDDVLIKLDVDKDQEQIVIHDIIRIFGKNTQKATISCGIGSTIEYAIIALDRAKLFGRNQIFHYK